MEAGDAPDIPEMKYEYLDHTADVQLHSWGDNLKEAIEQLVAAMYGYTVLDVKTVERVYSMDFEATGQDMPSLLYNLLDECLYNFNSEPFFIGRVVQLLALDEKNFTVKARAWGESLDLKSGKHAPGTEIKAITYSNMQINPRPDSSGYDLPP
ncbi:Archease domain-containing protein [Aphelenchoides fujianensis]|nr:Archease domain-containing protein [Aphelenchoides fujianensis]